MCGLWTHYVELKKYIVESAKRLDEMIERDGRGGVSEIQPAVNQLRELVGAELKLIALFWPASHGSLEGGAGGGAAGDETQTVTSAVCKKPVFTAFFRCRNCVAEGQRLVGQRISSQ